jgi:thymidylate synthase
MQNYLDLMGKVFTKGQQYSNRTGEGCTGTVGETLRWDLAHGFPLVTTKKMNWTAIVGELLWFIEGSTNVERLREITYDGEKKGTVWDANYDKQGRALGYTNGDLGPIYGHQWRDCNGVDQLANAVEALKEEMRTGVHNRRIMVDSWNPSDIPSMALPPCHYSFQFLLNPRKRLSCVFNCRSTDVLLGLPYNIASYALLTHIIASIIGADVGELVYNGADVHVYDNHTEAIRTQLNRRPKRLPILVHPRIKLLSQVSRNDFKLQGYESHEAILAPMAV